MDVLKRPKGSRRSARVFSVVILLATLGAIAATLSMFGLGEVEDLPGWGNKLFTAMSFYLCFVFLRTAVHLLLSFADLFFRERPEPLQEAPLVSILVPCFNEEKVLEKAIESILKLTYPNFEVIIIDDGSKDRTLEIASRLTRRAKVRVVHQNNAGKAEALNRGIRSSYGDFFFCMDADSVLDPRVLDHGIPYFRNQPSLAAVAGRVEVGNTGNALTSFQRLEYVSGLNLFKVAQSHLSMVTVIPGPIGIFRKSVVVRVGGYRSSTYAEDCELTIRLLMHGYRTIYVPEMVAVTEAPEDFRSLLTQRYRWSRGVVQAIRENLFVPGVPRNLRNAIILIYMFSESIVIPTLNFLFSVLAVEYALLYGTQRIAGQFFLQLTLLDVVLAVYCIITENRSLSLLLYAAVNRVTYGFSLEILRFLSIIDELLGLPMSWGKLVRKGIR